jgi:hypothetical protein
LAALPRQNYANYNNQVSGELMRRLCGIVIATGMIASPVAWAEPLSAGKPAGVHAAQEMTGKEWAVFGGIAALGIGIAIATSGGRSSDAPTQTVSVITTST